VTSYDSGAETDIGRRAIADMVQALESNDERNNFRWESFTDAFAREIRSAKVFVDCGAEFGFYMRLALKYGPTDIRIIAFEPERARYELLVESFVGRPNVEIYPYALSDTRSTLTATKPAQGASITFAPTVRNERFPLTEQSTVEIESVILDEFLQNVEVDVVKMDIEGAELFALRGMRRLLARGKATLFVEFHPHYIDALEPGGYEKLRRLLSDAGYSADGTGGRKTGGRAVLRPRSGRATQPVAAQLIISELYASLADASAERRRQLARTVAELGERQDLTAVEIHQVASLCKRVGDFATARKWFDRIDERWDGREAAAAKQFHLAEMSLAEGDQTAAVRHFQACLERIPNHQSAKAYLTQLTPS